MQRVSTRHILRALRRGSSCPVLAGSNRGEFVVKLRGASQGVAALVAELISAELAAHLGIPVPEHVLIELEADYQSEDGWDELADLLTRSVGLNVGLRYLPGAQELTEVQLNAVDDMFAAATLWLDGLVMNDDRVMSNPNIVSWNGSTWLIDHGAALPFQHWWPQVDEVVPRHPRFHDAHVFSSRRRLLQELDEQFAALVDRGAIESAVNAVPSEFLADVALERSIERTRSAYVAFLVKRRKAPRPFL